MEELSGAGELRAIQGGRPLKPGQEGNSGEGAHAAGKGAHATAPETLQQPADIGAGQTGTPGSPVPVAQPAARSVHFDIQTFTRLAL